ncbi:MAG: NAD(P)H-dependent oxidoreductase [Cyanomargarita calcarea GSE-NOS-MK-12-04C]|jgi:NAD(P)H-dependent FMN reductase|uniref:NAD(P)H-dependent oxidoreductase n=1 Tax=Cyanomargarita calcarea GSE-NOS-MK-12-04C TaxID=2839659 RepID=A0A951QJ74_9CYAN|nr:NAD(P)H-dependent oxidoreductase [Cyanomargarita calcarea GSE-NOS-MK-12-04C]
MTNTSLFIPVILGTTRQGRQSEHVAKFIVEQIATRDDVETELIDIRKIAIATNDAGESIKDPQFSATVDRADGLIIVAPEYNHGYPGLLKHVLDSCLKEYIHKAVGLCGVSAGPFGGTRVIQNLLPVMRELGLMTIFYDLNFGNVQRLFDESGNLIDKQTYIRRLDKFMNELVWMSTVLRYGRQKVNLENKHSTEVNLHANKPCPEMATRMGTDAIDTFIQASTDTQSNKVETS